MIVESFRKRRRAGTILAVNVRLSWAEETGESSTMTRRPTCTHSLMEALLPATGPAIYPLLTLFKYALNC